MVIKIAQIKEIIEIRIIFNNSLSIFTISSFTPTPNGTKNKGKYFNRTCDDSSILLIVPFFKQNIVNNIINPSIDPGILIPNALTIKSQLISSANM